jgi:hypothetical protein
MAGGFGLKAPEAAAIPTPTLAAVLTAAMPVVTAAVPVAPKNDPIAAKAAGMNDILIFLFFWCPIFTYPHNFNAAGRTNDLNW